MSDRSGRCVILSQLFYPELVSTGTLLTELAESMVRRGMEVSAIAAQPSTYDWGRPPGRMVHNGITIIRPPSTGLPKDKLLGRALNYLTYLAGTLWYVVSRREKGPLLIVTNPPFLGILGYLAKRIYGARYACLIHDIYPDCLPWLGFAGHKSLLVRLWHRLNRLIYSHADQVIVLGRQMAKIMAAKDTRPDPESRITLIPNWSDPELIVPKDKADSAFYRELDIDSGLVLMYSGNYSRWHNVEILVEAMERLRDEDIHLLFVGGGWKEPKVRRMVAEKGLDNVRQYPYQPKSQLGESLTACDVHLAVLEKGTAGLAVPCKLYGMLASGKPLLVVCEREGEMARVVEEEQCGLVVEPGDLDGLVEAILWLRDHPAERAEMGRRGRAAMEAKYTLSHVADMYVEILRQIQP